MCQGDRGSPGVLGLLGPPGIGIYGPKVNIVIWGDDLLSLLSSVFSQLFVKSSFLPISVMMCVGFQGFPGQPGPSGPHGLPGKGLPGPKVAQTFFLFLKM